MAFNQDVPGNAEAIIDEDTTNKILRKLLSIYRNVIDKDIIESVADNFNYDCEYIFLSMIFRLNMITTNVF